MDNDPLSNGFFGKVNKHMAYIYNKITWCI